MEICKFEVLQVGMNHERSSALIFPLSAISSSRAMNYEPSTMNSLQLWSFRFPLFSGHEP